MTDMSQYTTAQLLSYKKAYERAKEYDFTIFGIVKYFQLCMDNNPNCLDSLFIPQPCILHITKVGNMVRENRTKFLHKGCWARFKGYAYSQTHKAHNKEVVELAQKAREFEKLHGIPHTVTLEEIKQNPNKYLSDQEKVLEYLQLLEAGENRKRFQNAKEHGCETKFLYHVVRLLSEVEQILLTGDLDLQEKGRREHMKAIRRGEVPENDVIQWASEKEKSLEKLFLESKLPNKPRKTELQQILINCLEEHYGTLEDCLAQVGWAENALKEIDEILNKTRKKLYS